MKKRLFVFMVALAIYSISMVGFTMAENSGQISEVLSKFQNQNTTGFQTFTDPMPGPDGTFTDPMPGPDGKGFKVFTDPMPGPDGK